MNSNDFFKNAQQNAEKQNDAVLVGVRFTSNHYESSDEESIEELRGLLETAGGTFVAYALQTREVPDAATFIGSGKAKEISDLVKSNQAGLVVFDNELSPTQIRNLEELTGARVLDRSMLILDIFAMRAKTKEGKLQVELAQYQYEIPRLTASYDELSKLGGGIGTRGPGETKLETDRRYLRLRIRMIRQELQHLKNTRDTQRSKRQKGQIPTVSIIGYTNAGKSTLFNRLTQENVLAEDKLFATLDPITRKIELPSGNPLIISDTVGFIRKLPHHLVAAFKSTMEEISYSDLLVFVIDGSDPAWRRHKEVVSDIIGQLGAGEIPLITVYNKCDKMDAHDLANEKNSVTISAKAGVNIDAMLSLIEQKLNEQKRKITVHVPYRNGNIINNIHAKCDVLDMRYETDYVAVTLLADAEMYNRLKEYWTDEESYDGV